MPKVIRHPFDEHERFQTAPGGESMTKQSEAPACDINNLMSKYEKTGVIEHVRDNPGEYVDLVAPESYHAAMNVVAEAASAFEALPSAVRKRFSNEPAAFLAFAEDPDNLDEMREMGLLPPEEPAAPTPAPDPEPENTTAADTPPADPPSPS